MSIFARKKKPAAEAEKSTKRVDDSSARTAQWTYGSALGAKAVTAVVVIGWLCGPAAIALWMAPRASVAVESVAPDPLSSFEQTAGGYAVGFVGAWLSASKDDASTLEAYVSTAPPSLGDRPFEYRDLAVAAITPGEDQLLQVLIAGEVLEQRGDDETSWTARFFEVTVAVEGDVLVPVGFPSVVSGPATSTSFASLGLGNPMDSTSPASETVELFLTAYLTGQGSTTSYLSPGTAIAPIQPAPFTRLRSATFTSDVPPAEEPADGDTVRVQAVVSAETSAGQALPASYVLELVARAGRWEISRLDSTPLTSDSSEPATTPTPTPDPSGSTEGEASE